MGMLTDVRVKTAELRKKEYFLNDGDGLYLRVRLTGRVWVYRYYRDGKEHQARAWPIPDHLPRQSSRKGSY